MNLKQIDLGQSPTGQGGDDSRTAWTKANDNFFELSEHGALSDDRFRQMAALIKSLHPDLPALRLDFEHNSFSLSGMPVSADELFLPNYRPASKLVWDGSKFAVALSGDLAYMRHPDTRRKMLVVEPTSTNLVRSSCQYGPGSAWGGTGLSYATAPGVIERSPGGQRIPGTLITNEHATSSSVAISQSVGAYSSLPSTALYIVGRGTSDVIGFGLRDSAAADWVAMCTYRWSTGAVQLLVDRHGDEITFGVIKLSENVAMLWLTAKAKPDSIGAGRQIYLYPGYSGPGTTSIVYHIQLENGPFWTSPIVTEAAAVSRASDYFLVPQYGQLVTGGDPHGTVFAEFCWPAGFAPAGVNPRVLQEHVGDSPANRRMLLYNAGNSRPSIAAYMQNGAGAVLASVSTPPVGIQHRKVAVALSPEGARFAQEGVVSSLAAPPIVGGNPAARAFADVDVLAVGGDQGGPPGPVWISKITRSSIVADANELEAMTL